MYACVRVVFQQLATLFPERDVLFLTPGRVVETLWERNLTYVVSVRHSLGRPSSTLTFLEPLRTSSGAVGGGSSCAQPRARAVYTG